CSLIIFSIILRFLASLICFWWNANENVKVSTPLSKLAFAIRSMPYSVLLDFLTCATTSGQASLLKAVGLETFSLTVLAGFAFSVEIFSRFLLILSRSFWLSTLTETEGSGFGLSFATSDWLTELPTACLLDVLLNTNSSNTISSFLSG